MTTSPTTNQPELLPVIQADRELAALLVLDEHKNEPRAHGYRCGALDASPDVQIIARHRLTSTTPTLGDMVMVPRAVIREMRLAEADYAAAKPGATERLAPAIDALLAYERVSPIPTSVNGVGEREAKLRDALNRIADLGCCANGKRPAHKLFQDAINIATGAL